MRVLLIEDDTNLGPALQEFLTDQGYAVDLAATGATALERVRQYAYGLLVLDINLPDCSGLQLLAQLRSQGVDVAVLLLTARDALEDRVAGLDAGADDYVTKPFELAELAARVRVFARRASGQAQPILQLGPLSLDTVNREARVHQRRLSLSVREFSVLEELLSRAGKVVTKQQIVQSLSATDADFSENAVEVYIYRLRRRLEGTPITIQTIRGFGYLLEAP